MPPKLRPHQQLAVEKTPDKWGLWFKMRVGKTPTAIHLACTRAKKALIICPKSLKYNWQLEIDRWKFGTCEFIVSSKEDVRLNKGIPHDCDAVVVDEAHMAFANFKSKTYKALYQYIDTYKIKYVWLLTGTPYTSSAWSIFSYGNLLGQEGRIWSWLYWNRRYFYQIKMGRQMIPKPKPGMEAELQTILRSIGTVIDLKDVAEVPDDEDVVETFPLNPEQKALIKANFDPLPIVRYGRQHQLESGTLKGSAYINPVSIHCAKDDRLVEIAESTDKLIVVCRYLAQIDKYYELLGNKFPSKTIFKISGQEKETASEVAAKAEVCDKCIVIVQAETVMGYSLQSFKTTVFVSMDYSFINYDQLRYRSKDAEKKTGCIYIHFITEGNSIDRAVYDCVQRKQTFSEELFAKGLYNK